MTNEEHTRIIQEIAQNLTDQSKVTELLTSLSNDYVSTLGTIKDLEPLKEDNEKLRNANMQLFLQVGSVPKEKQTPEEPTIEDKPPIVEKTVDPIAELFNDKGELM